jgi:hypothetical protein
MNDANISEAIKAKNYCGEFIELFLLQPKVVRPANNSISAANHHPGVMP